MDDDSGNDGPGPLFWGILFLGIIGTLGFLMTAAGAAMGGM